MSKYFDSVTGKSFPTKTETLEHYQDMGIEAQDLKPSFWIDIQLRTIAITLEPALHHALVAYSADNGITRETAIKEILRKVMG